MAGIIFRLAFLFLSNLIALWIAVYFIEGFEIIPGLNNFFVVAGIFTFLNVFIRPILKLILTPVIILTLGFAIFLINAFILCLLDKLLINITISGTLPLIYATLIISLVNVIMNSLGKGIHKK
jgi:putative membrane protein